MDKSERDEIMVQTLASLFTQDFKRLSKLYDAVAGAAFVYLPKEYSKDGNAHLVLTCGHGLSNELIQDAIDTLTEELKRLPTVKECEA